MIAEYLILLADLFSRLVFFLIGNYKIILGAYLVLLVIYIIRKMFKR